MPVLDACRAHVLEWRRVANHRRDSSSPTPPLQMLPYESSSSYCYRRCCCCPSAFSSASLFSPHLQLLTSQPVAPVVHVPTTNLNPPYTLHSSPHSRFKPRLCTLPPPPALLFRSQEAVILLYLGKPEDPLALVRTSPARGLLYLLQASPLSDVVFTLVPPALRLTQ